MIDPEFAAALPPLSIEERKALLESLRKDGCRDPILFWALPGKRACECPIVDGHNRYRMCNEHKIRYRTRGMPFDDRSAVLRWMFTNQTARRNLSATERAYLIGKWIRENPSPKSAEQIASTAKIHRATAFRDQAFSHAVDVLTMKNPDMRSFALSDELSREDVICLANVEKVAIDEIYQKPRAQWKPLAQAAIQKSIGIQPSFVGQPILYNKKFAEMDALMKKLTKKKSEVLKDLGGKASWAYAYHEKLRLAMEQVYDALLAWEKEAQAVVERNRT